MTYEYWCSHCDHKWEEEQKMSDEKITKCPKCENETAVRMISLSSFVLKGKWFKTGGY
jgi:putative FmdB family regulatory protein